MRCKLPRFLLSLIISLFLYVDFTYVVAEKSTCVRTAGNDKTCPGSDELEGLPMKNLFDQVRDWKSANSMYDFTAKDISGHDVDFSVYKGHVTIVVNVASECGLTDSNYAQLVELHDKYKDSEQLRILAFPCDQFYGQEPGSSKDIANFAKKYKVEFDMFEKIKVNGPDAHPLWKWLKEKQGGFLGNAIKWNFTKFIVDKNGQPVDRFSPTTPPNDLEATLKKLF